MISQPTAPPFFQLQLLTSSYAIPANSSMVCVQALTLQAGAALTIPAGSYLYVTG